MWCRRRDARHVCVLPFPSDTSFHSMSAGTLPDAAYPVVYVDGVSGDRGVAGVGRSGMRDHAGVLCILLLLLLLLFRVCVVAFFPGFPWCFVAGRTRSAATLERLYQLFYTSYSPLCHDPCAIVISPALHGPSARQTVLPAAVHRLVGRESFVTLPSYRRKHVPVHTLFLVSTFLLSPCASCAPRCRFGAVCRDGDRSPGDNDAGEWSYDR